MSPRAIYHCAIKCLLPSSTYICSFFLTRWGCVWIKDLWRERKKVEEKITREQNEKLIFIFLTFPYLFILTLPNPPQIHDPTNPKAMYIILGNCIILNILRHFLATLQALSLRLSHVFYGCSLVVILPVAHAWKEMIVPLIINSPSIHATIYRPKVIAAGGLTACFHMRYFPVLTWVWLLLYFLPLSLLLPHTEYLPAIFL